MLHLFNNFAFDRFCFSESITQECMRKFLLTMITYRNFLKQFWVIFMLRHQYFCCICCFYYFMPGELFTPAVAGGVSLESEI